MDDIDNKWEEVDEVNKPIMFLEVTLLKGYMAALDNLKIYAVPYWWKVISQRQVVAYIMGDISRI